VEPRTEKLPGSGSLWKQIAKVEKSATEYTESGVAKGEGAAYRVRAYNDAGESAYSNIVHVTVSHK